MTVNRLCPNCESRMEIKFESGSRIYTCPECKKSYTLGLNSRLVERKQEKSSKKSVKSSTRFMSKVELLDDDELEKELED